MVKSVLLGEQAIAPFLPIHLLGTFAYKADRTDVWGKISRLGWGEHSVATFTVIYYTTFILLFKAIIFLYENHVLRPRKGPFSCSLFPLAATGLRLLSLPVDTSDHFPYNLLCNITDSSPYVPPKHQYLLTRCILNIWWFTNLQYDYNLHIL
jgi:hypothetical protein